MQYLRLFFSAGLIASSFTAETLFLEHRFVWCNNHLTTFHFQYVFLRTPNRLFLYFLWPFYISGQEPSKMSDFMLYHFSTVPFKTSSGSPVMLLSLEISMLILFPKLEPPWLPRWSLFPLSAIAKPVTPSITNEDIIFSLPSQLSCSYNFSGEIGPLTPNMLWAFRLCFHDQTFLLRRKSVINKNFSCSACEQYTYRTLIISFLTVLPLGIYANLSFALHPGVWLNCLGLREVPLLLHPSEEVG